MLSIDYGKVVIDRDLNIVKLSSYFYELMGQNDLTSLASCFSPEDCKKISEECTKKSSRIICKAIVGEEKNFIIDIKEYLDGLYRLHFFDLMNITSTLVDVVNTNNLYENILSSFTMEYFTFNLKAGQILLQNLTGVKLELSFSEFFKYLEKKSIVIKDLLKFKENLLAPEKYCVFEAKKEERNIFISLSPFENSFGGDMILGTIVYDRLAQSILFKKSITDECDGLTGLKNKIFIQKYLDNRVDVCKNNTTLLIIDIDDFKEINDTYGHKYGDEILVAVSKIIRRNIGPNGVAGRFGGDEFIAILNTVDTVEVKDIARSIRMGVQWISAGKKDRQVVTCSIGIARYPDNVKNSIDLFKLADKCLYIAKNKGRNRYILYTYSIHGDVLHDNNTPTEQSMDGEVLNEEYYELLDQCYLGDISIEGMLKKMFSIGRFSHASLYGGPQMKEMYGFGERIGITTGQYILTENYLELFSDKNYLCLSNTSSLLTTHRFEVEFLGAEFIKALFQYLCKDKNGKIVAVISLEVLRSPRTFKSKEINFLFMICRLISRKLNEEIK